MGPANGSLPIKLKIHTEEVAQAHLQLTSVRDHTVIHLQLSSPALPLFSSLQPPYLSLSLSPTPDNEERGPVVKSYLKKSSELRV